MRRSRGEERQVEASRTNETETNRETVLRFLGTYASGDLDALLAMLDDGATWWIAGTLPLSGTKTKWEYGEALAGVNATFTAPMTMTAHGVTAEGERIAVEAECYGELADGRVYNNHFHFLFTVRDGKIHAVKEYLDTVHVQEVFFG